jgi:predicted signal transduction protein with EAL and GGDEF domain
VRIGGSVGIALFPQDGQLAIKLLERADQALYEAKRAGGGTFRYFSDDCELRQPA